MTTHDHVVPLSRIAIKVEELVSDISYINRIQGKLAI